MRYRKSHIASSLISRIWKFYFPYFLKYTTSSIHLSIKKYCYILINVWLPYRGSCMKFDFECRWLIDIKKIIYFIKFECLHDLCMSHFSPNRSHGGPHYSGFFFHVICCRASQKNTRSFRFFAKLFGVSITQDNLKNWKWHCWGLSIWIKFGQ